jgi:hypothetical protein
MNQDEVRDRVAATYSDDSTDWKPADSRALQIGDRISIHLKDTVITAKVSSPPVTVDGLTSFSAIQVPEPVTIIEHDFPWPRRGRL